MTLSDAASASASFTVPAAPSGTTLSFGLTVTDAHGAVASDTTVVTISNLPPSADAGPDLAAKPLALVPLAVLASDSDGSIAAYAWTQLSGPAVAPVGAECLGACRRTRRHPLA